MGIKIFVVNPGSTSTKVALFDGNSCLFDKTIRHNPDEIKAFTTAASQFDYRYATIMEIIGKEGIDPGTMDAFVGRGGILRPLKGGTYIVCEEMLENLKSSRYGDHASNLGAIIAARLAGQYGKTAYVVNPVVVDELMDEARLTGLPDIKRKSVFHALNQKAIAMRAAAEMGIEYGNGRFIVAHLGGGISVGAHDRGQVIDVSNGLEEGPMTPERAGALPTLQLVELCFSGRYTKDQIKKMLVGNGGLIAYTGTSDCRKLEEQAVKDENVRKTVDAMAYGISREICACAAALRGNMDSIIITGGLAYWPYVVDEIKKRVSFLGKILVYPGEDEMAALAEGVIRVLEGREQAYTY